MIDIELDIEFPHATYDVQRIYMSKVLQCLIMGQHGVLESPTGTGKTLCLLCSTLRWLSIKKEALLENEVINLDSDAESDTASSSSAWVRSQLPKIIYSSRTHTQLSHVMRELETTAYKSFKKTVLGSRDQLCIHPTVSKHESLAMKNTLCRLHMREKTCQFANRVEQKKNEMIAHGVLDIEDLVQKSKKLGCCPYYMSKELQETAEIIFLPYNYLLDPQIRKSLNIKLEGSVIIFDEAHNVESICEESASISISSSDISNAVEELTIEMQEVHKMVGEEVVDIERDYNAEDLCNLKEKLQKLEELFNDLDPKQNNIEGVTYKGSYIFEILTKAGFTIENVGELANLALKVSDTLISLHTVSFFSKRGAALRKLGDSLLLLFSSIGPTVNYKIADGNFKVYIERELVKKSSNMWLSKSDVSTSNAKKMNYWCFNPGFGMSGLIKNNVHCVILTSGTLSPIESTVRELSLLNPIILENPHIIKPSQILVNIVPKGPRNLELNSSYQNRNNEEYWIELGLMLQNYSRIIPNGLLMFFPSYTTLNKAQKSWQSSGLWQKICNNKPIFVEPPNKVLLRSILADYRKVIDTGNGKGAILLGVCRGKISEGFDFCNEYCRGVLVTGIPFPPLHDPKINLKKQYIDERNSLNKDITGDFWYSCEAIRAVNQAVGRVIRHSKDFGAILLCDIRFGNVSNIRYLSKWLLPYIKTMKTFGESIASLHGFFKENSQIPVQLSRTPLKNNPMPSIKSMTRPSKKIKVEELSQDEEDLLSRLSRANIFPQPGTSSSFEPQPGTSSSFDPQPGTSRSLYPQPGTSRSCEPQPGTSRSLYPQPGTSSSFEPQPGTSRSLYSQPGTSRSCEPQPGTSRSLYPQPGTSSSFEPQPGTSRSLYPQPGTSSSFEPQPGTSRSLYPQPGTSSSFEPQPGISRSLYSQPGTSTSFEPQPSTSSYQPFCLSHLNNQTHENFEYSIFDNTSTPEVQELVTKATEINIQHAKKRVIKLVPIQFELRAGNSDSPRHLAQNKRINEIKDFICEVKITLDADSYSTFSKVVKQYQKKHCIKTLITSLVTLFPLEDKSLRSLLKGECYMHFIKVSRPLIFNQCNVIHQCITKGPHNFEYRLIKVIIDMKTMIKSSLQQTYNNYKRSCIRT